MSAFQYSLNASTIKTTPILRQIEVAAEAGYAGIELWHDDIDTYLASGGSIQDIRSCVDDRGLTVPMTIYIKDWFQPAGDAHLAAMETAKRKLEQAAAVGASHAVAGRLLAPPTANWKTSLSRVAGIGRRIRCAASV